MKIVMVLACLMATALAVPAHADESKIRMYKCVDGTGKVYYSDKMNPDCGQASELNRQGVVMKKKEKEVPKAAGKPAKVEDPVDAEKGLREQQRRDRALMATYTSEEEIDAARDRSLAIPAQGIKAAEAKLEKVNGKLTELKKQADALAAQKKPLPAPLLEDVAVNQKDIGTLEADLTQRKAQSDSIRAKFEADKLRFRELHGGSQAAK
jgi:Domain of unknown function (DUF4124)